MKNEATELEQSKTRARRKLKEFTQNGPAVVNVNGVKVDVGEKHPMPAEALESAQRCAGLNLEKATAVDFLVQFEADAAAQKEGATIERAVKLGELLMKQKAEVTRLENELRIANEAVGRTERDDLPQLMKELSLTLFQLEDGNTIELKSDVKCGITEDRRVRAHAWLIEHDFGGLIKTEVVVPFDRGAHEEAMAFFDELLESGKESVEMKESVHFQTLKSFVKEQLEKGTTDFPMDLFGVFQFDVVKVTPPKKKKGAA